MRLSKQDKANSELIRYNLQRLCLYKYGGDRKAMAKAHGKPENRMNDYLEGRTDVRFEALEEMRSYSHLPYDEYFRAKDEELPWPPPTLFHEPSYKQRYETILQQYNELLYQTHLKDETIAQLLSRLQQLENQLEDLLTPQLAAEPTPGT